MAERYCVKTTDEAVKSFNFFFNRGLGGGNCTETKQRDLFNFGFVLLEV